MPKVLKVVPELCTGCNQCALACAWIQTGAFEPNAAVIRVQFYGEQLRFAPYTCFQCDEAWCMPVCPTNAIAVEGSTGARLVIEEACVGCGLCTIACPFGTIFLSMDTGKARKCDLCRGDPACVRVCPTDALQYVEDDRARDWIGPWAEQHHSEFLRQLQNEGGGAEA